MSSQPGDMTRVVDEAVGMLMKALHELDPHPQPVVAIVLAPETARALGRDAMSLSHGKDLPNYNHITENLRLIGISIMPVVQA